MLLGLAGWLAGFDGSFEFTNIADPYLDVEAGIDVPYRAMRSMPAVFGSLTVGVVYWIMRESGYPIIVAAFSAGLVLFGASRCPPASIPAEVPLTVPASPDNLHVVETRLILLDGALILSMALSLLSYIKFHQQRYRAFTPAWWMWLSATGFWLACTLGCKMVGLFTFLTVGTAVAWDLWDLMNVKRRSPLTMVCLPSSRLRLRPLLTTGRCIRRSNSQSTSLRASAALSSSRSASTSHSSGSTSRS